MELKPVRDYSAAQYPSLSDYVASGQGSWIRALGLTVALAMLASLLSGCGLNGSIS